jgi:phosphoserine phosphatase
LKEPILISITGLDRSGITASIMQVLVEFNINVLDIGQSVIHNALSLGMLSIAGLGIAFRAKPIVKASAKQSLNTQGLDGVLYLMGLSERETK